MATIITTTATALYFLWGMTANVVPGNPAENSRNRSPQETQEERVLDDAFHRRPLTGSPLPQQVHGLLGGSIRAPLRGGNPKQGSANLFAPMKPPTEVFGFSSERRVFWGLQVVSVNRQSMAHRLGLEPGDVVTSINGQSMSGLSGHQPNLNAVLQSTGDRVLLIVDKRRVRLGESSGQRFVRMWLPRTHQPHRWEPKWSLGTTKIP